MKFIILFLISLSLQAKIYNLNTPTAEVQILLESEQKALKLHRNNKYNCFALASGTGRHTPGDAKKGPLSVGKTVSVKAIKEAMKQEKAIPLGLDYRKSDPTKSPFFDSNQSYYLLASFFMTDEYHFVRLFEEGWWSKPSKVGMGMKLTKFRLPTRATYAVINKSPRGRKYLPVGYYLFPVSKRTLGE